MHRYWGRDYRALYQQIYRLGLPLAVSGIVVALMGVIDATIVGHLPDIHSMGGVGLGATVLSSLLWVLGFLRYGIPGYAGQAQGAGDNAAMKVLLKRGLFITFVMAVAVMIFATLTLTYLLTIMGAVGMVHDFAMTYSHIRIVEIPFALLNFLLIGWFMGCQNNQIIMRGNTIQVVANASISSLFVFVFDLGVTGVAWGTVIANGLASAYYIYALMKQYPHVLSVDTSDSPIWRWQGGRYVSMQQLLGTAGNVGLRSLLLNAMFWLMWAVVARIGVVELATIAIMMQLMMFMVLFIDGVAGAATGMTADAIGKKDKQSLFQIITANMIFGAGVSIGLAIIAWIIIPHLFPLLTDKQSVVDMGIDLTIWLVIMPIFACACYIYDGVYIGAADGTSMRDSMLIAFLCTAPLLAIAPLYPVMGGLNDVLFAIMVISHTARGVPQYLWLDRIYAKCD